MLTMIFGVVAEATSSVLPAAASVAPPASPVSVPTVLAMQDPTPEPQPTPASDGAIPHVKARPLPGGASDAVLYVVGTIITFAGYALLGLFFLGLAWIAVGRFANHPTSSTRGGTLLMSALGGAALWGIGQGLVGTFASGNYAE